MPNQKVQKSPHKFYELWSSTYFFYVFISDTYKSYINSAFKVVDLFIVFVSHHISTF